MNFQYTQEAIEAIEKEMAKLHESAQYVDKYIVSMVESDKGEKDGTIKV